MQNETKRFSAALLALLLAASAASCGTAGTPSADDTTASDIPAETTADPNDRSAVKDSLPDDLDFGGRSFRLICRGNEEYGKFESSPEEETGDIVSDALYTRDRKVEERLNFKMEYTKSAEADATKYMNAVRTVIMAGDDAYDAVIGVQWQLLTQTPEGLYYNLIDAPYLDWSKPWWNVDYMEAVSVNNTQRYMLTGDISLMTLRNLSTMFYNKKLYNDLYKDPDGLYDIVLDGKWTQDQMQKMITEIYQDVNGDGTVDNGDILGLGANTVTQADHYSFTAGLVLSTRDKDGFPQLITSHDRNIQIMEKLNKLYYETPGMRIYPSSEQDTVMTTKFVEGGMLFYGNRLYAADLLREMKDEYGIIPMPKLDEAQKDYIALVHDSASAYAIPVTLPELDFSCAVVEALCAEAYRTVTPAYYEVALKVKYTRDDTSAQVIDMIHDAMMTDFVYANNYSLKNNMGTIARTLLASAGNSYMSKYDSIKDSVGENLKAMIDKAKEA